MTQRLLRLAGLLSLSLLLSGCGTNGFYSVAVVTDGVHEIPSGETVDGLLLVLDGRVRVQEGAKVAGSIYLLDGDLALNGNVAGDVVQLGRAMTVIEKAHLAGDLRQAGGKAVIASGVVVEGRMLRGSDVELDLRPAGAEQSPVTWLGWTLAQALVLGTVAALVTRILPKPVQRIADAVVEHPLISLALGILVGIVAPSLLVVMAFTVLLIPVTVLGLMLGGATIAYGLIAWGCVVARLLVRRWRTLSLSWAAFLGTALFMLLMEAITFVPLVGGLLPLLLMVTAVGAVLLTVFGRQRFVPDTERIEVD